MKLLEYKNIMMEFLEEALAWLLRHIFFCFICGLLFLCDLCENGMLQWGTLTRLSEWFENHVFLLYLKNCVRGVYELRITLLGLSISVSSLFFAALSFMYNSFKENSFGIPMSDIYMWEYGEQLERKRRTLVYCVPVLMTALFLNLTGSALAIFSYLLIRFFTVLSRMVLIFEEDRRNRIVIRKLREELIEYRVSKKAEHDSFHNLKRIAYKNNKQPHAKAFLLKASDSFLDLIVHKREGMPEIDPAAYFDAFYEFSRGILTAGIGSYEGEDDLEEDFLLKIMERIGHRLEENPKYETADKEEKIIQYLSSELGIITALINCSKNVPGYVFDQLFDRRNSKLYWPGYVNVIYDAVGIFLELLYEKRILIEPLLSYLIGKGMLYGCTAENTRCKRPKREFQRTLMLCRNFLVFKEFTYADIRQITDLWNKERSENLPPCARSTYLGAMGFWRYRGE